MKNYNVAGYKMIKNQETWEMESEKEITTLTIESILNDVDTFEDREFLEGEISNKFGFDYFEIVTLSIN